MAGAQTEQERNLANAWGRVGTSISGLTEAAKYRDGAPFEERVATFLEQLEALRATPGYDATPRPTSACQA